MNQEAALTRHQVCQYLDLGLLAPELTEISVVYKPASLWYSDGPRHIHCLFSVPTSL